MFDEDYWFRVDNRPRSCKNCGNAIEKHPTSSTGWIHKGSWVGIRCQGMLCIAEPTGK
jgi:hypothetical protein